MCLLLWMVPFGGKIGPCHCVCSIMVNLLQKNEGRRTTGVNACVSLCGPRDIRDASAKVRSELYLTSTRPWVWNGFPLSLK